jgi:hypothetical protein
MVFDSFLRVWRASMASLMVFFCKFILSWLRAKQICPLKLAFNLDFFCSVFEYIVFDPFITSPGHDTRIGGSKILPIEMLLIRKMLVKIGLDVKFSRGDSMLHVPDWRRLQPTLKC